MSQWCEVTTWRPDLSAVVAEAEAEAEAEAGSGVRCSTGAMRIGNVTYHEPTASVPVCQCPGLGNGRLLQMTSTDDSNMGY